MPHRFSRIAEQAVVEHGAFQKPHELAELLRLLDERRVRTLLEIGSAFGGTLWAWRQLGIEVFAIDLPTSYPPPVKHGATVFKGDARDERLRLTARQAIGFNRQLDALFIDGDHAYESVRADFNDFSPWVRPGGLVALHDICVHPSPPYGEVGVNRLWLEVTPRFPERMEIVRPPETWGGIGIVRLPA